MSITSIGVTAQQAAIGGGGPTDPLFDEVVLLMGFEGASPTDESSLAQTVTSYGDAVTSTAQPKYGSKSGDMPATVPSAFSVPSNAAFNFASETTPFTYEAFVRFEDFLLANYFYTILSRVEFEVEERYLWQFYFYRTGSSTLVAEYYSNELADYSGDFVLFTTSNFTYDPSTYYHFAVDFDGTTHRMYIDGNMLGSTTDTTVILNAATRVGVGAIFLDGDPIDTLNQEGALAAYIDEVRMTIGTARYATDVGFTPPTQAFPRS